MKYHINSKGEAGRCRATTKACPFGGESEHYGSAQEARLAYESKHFNELLAKHQHEPSPALATVELQLLQLATMASPTLASRGIYLQAKQALQEASDSKLNRLQELYRVRAARAQESGLEEVAEASYRVFMSIETVRWEARSTRFPRKELATRAVTVKNRKLYKENIAYEEKKRDEKLLELLGSEPQFQEHEVRDLYSSEQRYSFVAPQDEELWRALGAADEVYVGKLTEEERSQAYERLEGHAEELSQALQKSMGEKGLGSEYFEDGAGRGPVEGSPDFELINGGSENNVYLHRPTMMIYKVRHSRADANLRNAGITPMEDRSKIAVLSVEQAYGKLDTAKLEDLGASYSKTYFITPQDGKLPMVVQPYLDPVRYIPYHPSEEEYQSFKGLGLDDMNADNLRLDSKTGKLVLFDCIYGTMPK